MSGEPDPLYVRARAVLLDAIDALGAHRDAVVLVGAQAIYLHTGETDLVVAEHTTDADRVVSPTNLADRPPLEELLLGRGFVARGDPGAWVSSDGVYVDLMVPEALAGSGRRGASLGLHGRRVARRSKGLEGALVDRENHTIAALDPADDRVRTMLVAGPGALLVAKVHKIIERLGDRDRAQDKDSLDVLRLLQAISSEELARRLKTLLDKDTAGAVTAEAIERVRPCSVKQTLTAWRWPWERRLWARIPPLLPTYSSPSSMSFTSR